MLNPRQMCGSVRTYAQDGTFLSVLILGTFVLVMGTGCGTFPAKPPGEAPRETTVIAEPETNVDVGEAETVETTTTIPTESVTPTLNLKPVLDALGDITSEIRTVQTSVQDLRQQAGTADTRLIESVERVEALTQNVSSTVSTYGMSPGQVEVARFLFEHLTFLALAAVSTVMGLMLLGWAAPWPIGEGLTGKIIVLGIAAAGLAMLAAPWAYLLLGGRM